VRTIELSGSEKNVVEIPATLVSRCSVAMSSRPVTG
jgi:hypothetical protein